MNKTAFNALLEIGYSLSDFQEPDIGETLSIIFLSKDNEPDVCIFVDPEECREICKISEKIINEENNKD